MASQDIKLTDEEINEVFEKVYPKVKMIYPEKLGWFPPVLRKLNDFHVHKSQKLNVFFGRFAEILDRFYLWLIVTKNRFLDWLFPRKDQIYGTNKDAYVSAKLTFGAKQDVNKGIHHMCCDFWARNRLGGWRKLATGFTNLEGNLKLHYDFLESRKWRYKRFYLDVYQTTHVFFDQEKGHVKPKNVVFERFPMKKSDMSGMGNSFGELQLFYWEYRTDTDLPRVVIKDHEEDAPEYYTVGRNRALQEQFIPIEIQKEEHLALIDIDPNLLNVDTIQKAYPTNLTVAMEHELKGSTRSDYWYGRRLMNGMNAATFVPIDDEPGNYWAKIFGSCDYPVNQEYAFPTVEIKVNIGKNGLPTPLKIKVIGQTNMYNKDPYQVQEITPADGDKWNQAKRIARVTGGLSAECDDHFAGTHVNTEQFAIAARRNLRLSPISDLLLPHLKEVCLINQSADQILLGTGYIPKASALTADGILERCKDVLGAHDWKNWQPMEVLSHAHDYAKAEHLFWEVTGQFIDYFFKEFEEGIRTYWYEVYAMSEDIVEHSVPLIFSDSKDRMFAEERRAYYAKRYRIDLSLKRRTINGVTKAMSPITENKKEPTDTDIKNLKAFCQYTIMMASFMHSHVNEMQYEDIGEVRYCSLGLRYSEDPNGVFQPEDNFSISPDVTRATQMMWFSNLLSRTEYGFITRNEEGDIHPYFANLLESKREEFDKLGFNVDNIESRTNI